MVVKELFALCEYVQMFPADKEAAAWKETISNYTRNYLFDYCQKEQFRNCSFRPFYERRSGRYKRAGDYWYRYFMPPEAEWWVGINANLASSGIGLLKASVVLHDPKLKAYAQKQLDWIIGINPFNSSTIEGVGYNHPKHFPGSNIFILRPPYCQVLY